ncbi:DUF2141 domain-containing protein [Methylorubrum extorquens]|uniref:DUF2141 domain-containing protein n=1 Tax=Methylorubrum extorquens TaxID=408 RepID=A0AAX3WCY5_METEX|nr:MULTISPECIES: DUF2141 domain-containing protein [Methylobacteriaceae]KQQ21605.1 hypothetical protein ASF56_18845 [Methylobacterium sp. Leaf122]WHQ68440.1 DUF2141 domain-containing protein [Methylorubrum extorquens]
MRAAFLAGLAVLAAIAGPAWAAGLEVIVEGAEPGPGEVYVTLCQGGLSEAACPIGRSAPVRGGAERFVFTDVPAGVWAVAAFQDENGNGRLDRTGLGLPLEPYGFSGAVARRARPDFASASFALREPGAAVRIRIARPLPRR